MIKILSLFALLLSLQPAVFAQNFSNIPGLIPLERSREPAKDLVYEGKAILPDKAMELLKSGAISDIADLNPVETSDLWSSRPQALEGQPIRWSENGVPALDPADDDIGVNKDGEVFKFEEVIAAPIGNFTFKASKLDENGVRQNYLITFSKRVHNNLLRKGLLRKTGYSVQPIAYLSKFRLDFNGVISKNIFTWGKPTRPGNQEPENPNDALEEGEEDDDEFTPRAAYYLVGNTGGDATRWVVNHDDEDARHLDLQDAIITKVDAEYYTLAKGPIFDVIVRGRRLINALAIIYALAEVPESLNLYSWKVGRQVNGQVYLPFDGSEEFSTTNDDARWLIKRIAKLKREDFVEVVAAANYPEPVAKLAVEKMISRRNSLVRLFKMDIEKIRVNKRVSHGQALKKAKLLQQDWPGYGSRFTYGDPDSPLSNSEIRAFFKSKFIGSIIANAADQFSKNLLPNTDVGELLLERQQELARDAFFDFLRTGQVQKTSFGWWTEEVFGMKAIASRDVVAGSYLGTDNVVQLADSAGVALNGGVIIGTDGLKKGQFVTGSAQAFTNRVYTHLKPIKSIKKALKEPYRNILIPMIKHDIAGTLDELTQTDMTELDAQAVQKKVKKIIRIFKEELSIGESLLITDGVGGDFSMQAGYSWDERLRAQIRFGDTFIALSRLHIHRRDENTIQIYKDRGRTNRIHISLSGTAGIEIFNMGASLKHGKAKVKFTTLNINPDMDSNPDVLTSVKLLQGVLQNNSVEALHATYPPYILKHKFVEKERSFKFLTFKSLRLKIRDIIDVLAPDGSERSFIKYLQGKRKGKDIQELGIEALNEILTEVFDEEDITIPNPGSGNSGDSFKGKSVARTVSYESEVLKHADGGEVLLEPFVHFNYYWKGWDIEKDEAVAIVNEITEKYEFGFYDESDLNDTELIQLYRIAVDVYVYNNGLNNAAMMNEAQVWDLLRREGTFLSERYRDRPDRRLKGAAKRRLERIIYKFNYRQKRYFTAIRKRKPKDAAKWGARIIELLEDSLFTKGFVEAVGGLENIYVQSSINGFREGDENGDTPILSDHIGEFGSDRWQGPLRHLQTQLGMTEGEFYVYWLLRRI